MTSECKEQQEKIARFLIGDLTGEDQRSLENHLAVCPVCRAEQESYTRTLDLLQSSQDEPVPRNFFIHPEERESNPWLLYRRMKPLWQWTMAAAALLVLLVGMAVFSRLQFRADADGWTIVFGSDDRITALEAEISNLRRERSGYVTTAQLLEIRTGFGRILADISRQQQILLTALKVQDSKYMEQLKTAEAQWRKDTRGLLAEMYRDVSGYWAQDLESIGSRFKSLEMNQAVQAQQTGVILTALQHEDSFGLNKPENSK